jgi:hypothetical protein
MYKIGVAGGGAEVLDLVKIPRVEEAHDEVYAVAVVKLPKLVAFPVEAKSM